RIVSFLVSKTVRPPQYVDLAIRFAEVVVLHDQPVSDGLMEVCVLDLPVDAERLPINHNAVVPAKTISPLSPFDDFASFSNPIHCMPPDHPQDSRHLAGCREDWIKNA